MGHDPVAMALMSVTGDASGAPSLEVAAAQLGVAVDDIDRHYGIVPIDPLHGVYAVQVRADRLRDTDTGGDAFRGPFANPRIEPLVPDRGKTKVR